MRALVDRDHDPRGVHVEIHHQEHDEAPERFVGVWAFTDEQLVHDGAGLLADACDALGLGGQALMSALLTRLHHDEREWLARVACEIARHAPVGDPGGPF